jgi:RNA polymerase sigma-70 factor (ECF subfamily)
VLLDPDSGDAARVLAGDLDAFEGIVARWQGRLFALALRLCRDRARAEDMTQEAFLRAFRSLAQWRGAAAFGTWLMCVALNAFRSHLRLRGWVRQESLAQLQEVATKAPASEPEQADRVRRAVAALPARYRDALTLYYFLDRDVAHAAVVLGVAEGTLKARLHRGRELLRRMLEPTP